MVEFEDIIIVECWGEYLVLFKGLISFMLNCLNYSF